jgi:hypothetical protein
VSNNRRDFLRDCHSQVSKQVKELLPFDAFGAAYCSRCLQPECTRSTHGSTLFDKRVTTWQDRLFLNVPRMDQGDPRFESIAHKEFVPAQETLVVRGWDDGVAHEEPKEFVPEFLEEPVVEEVPTNDEPPPVYFKPVSDTSSISRDTLLMNTPVSREQYLPGASRTSVSHSIPKKTIDSWGASEQSTPSEVIVKAGATVRFGSGSGVSK